MGKQEGGVRREGCSGSGPVWEGRCPHPFSAPAQVQLGCLTPSLAISAIAVSSLVALSQGHLDPPTLEED